MASLSRAENAVYSGRGAHLWLEAYYAADAADALEELHDTLHERTINEHTALRLCQCSLAATVRKLAKLAASIDAALKAEGVKR